MLTDRLARVRLTSGQILAAVVTFAVIAVVALAVAVLTFSRQAGQGKAQAAIARTEARHAIDEAVKSGHDNLVRTCALVRALIPDESTGQPKTPYGQRLGSAATDWVKANRCP